MQPTEQMRLAFNDELEKIGAGMARMGRTPMRMGTAASRSSIGRASKGLGKFFKGTGTKSLLKTSAMKPSRRQLLAAAATGGGLALYGERKLKNFAQDVQMGRAMRKAQEQQR